MSKQLFSAASDEAKADEKRKARDEAKARGEAVEQALREEGFMDDFGARLGKATSVRSVRYETFRKPGRPWGIEHALDGCDYIYQVLPLKPITAHPMDVIGSFIGMMDVIFPRSVKIDYRPPSDQLSIKFFTIRVHDVAALPGWEGACRERALTALVDVDAWPA